MNCYTVYEHFRLRQIKLIIAAVSTMTRKIAALHGLQVILLTSHVIKRSFPCKYQCTTRRLNLLLVKQKVFRDGTSKYVTSSLLHV